MCRHTAVRSVIVACLLLAGVAIPARPPASWASRGPGGGGAMYSPAINPLNPDEMYIACDMTPEFHSLDGGAHWQTEDFRQLQSNRDCAVRFTRDPMVRWALDYTPKDGGDTVRPKKSSDGGKSWHYLPETAWPASRTGYVLYADFQHPERAVVSADYRQLWVTRDGGNSFSQVAATTSPNGLHLGGCFFDGETIYAGTSEGIYLSTDGGKSFTRREIPGIPAGEYPVSYAGSKARGHVQLFCVTSRQVWAGITGGDHTGYAGVYLLDAERNAWVKKVKGIDATAHPWFVRMADGDIDTAYLAGGSTVGAPTVYKTTDGGDSWQAVFLTAGNRNIATGWAGDGGDFQWSFPEYALGFELCPGDKNRLIVTDLGCAHLSGDGGRSWTQVYTGLTAPRNPGDPLPGGAAYQGCGLEMTSSWDIVWFDAQHLYVCATDVKGFRSSDGGKRWGFDYRGHTLNTMYRALKHPVYDAWFAATSSVHDLYMSTYLQDARIDRGRGQVLYTTDAGASWKLLKDFGKPVVWVAADPRAKNTLYAAVASSGEGGIYATTELNKGPQAAWTRLSNPPRTEGHPFNLHVLDDGTLVVSFSGRRAGNSFTASSGVFVSADGGRSWEDRSDPGMRYWTKDLVIDPQDPAQQTWYACVYFAWGAAARNGKSGLYRTRDRGKSWTLLADSTLAPSGVLNVDSIAFDPAHPGECYLTTEYDGLWHCANINAGQPAFTQVASYPFRHPERVFFNPFNRREMWVTSFGNGIRVGDTGD